MTATLPLGVGQDIRNIWPKPLDVKQAKHPRAVQSQQQLVRNYQAEEVVPQAPRLEVRETQGKGKGLFTLDRIPAYSRVLEDYCLLGLAIGEDLPELWSKYQLLPADQRLAFDALTLPSDSMAKIEAPMVEKLLRRGYDGKEASNMARMYARWQTNAFKTAPGEDYKQPGAFAHKWAYAVFATIARINHSCTCNCHTHFRADGGSQVLYALRDVEVGEEISISYFDITMPRLARQSRAQTWGFTCTCSACTLGSEGLGSVYEDQLAVVHEALQAEKLAWKKGPAPNMIGTVRHAVSIASDGRYPWLVAALPRLYRQLLSQIEKTAIAESKLLAEKALEWESKITGPNSAMSCSDRHYLHLFLDEVHNPRAGVAE